MGDCLNFCSRQEEKKNKWVDPPHMDKEHVTIGTMTLVLEVLDNITHETVNIMDQRALDIVDLEALSSEDKIVMKNAVDIS